MSKKLIKKLEQIAESAKEERFDINRGKKFRSAASQKAVPGLSKLWYDNLASQFLHDFGKEIEDGWEEKVVKQFVDSQRVTANIEIDAEKLSKSIKKALEARQDSFLETKPVSVSLKEISQRLRQEALIEERFEHVINSSAGDLLAETVSYDGRFTHEEYLEDLCGSRDEKNVHSFLKENYSHKKHTKRQWDSLYDEADTNIGFE